MTPQHQPEPPLWLIIAGTALAAPALYLALVVLMSLPEILK